MGDEAAPASGGLLRFIFAAFFFTSHLSAAVKILVDDDVARFTEGVDSQSLIRDVLSSTVAPFTMKDLFESVLAKGQVPLFSLSELLANLTFPLPDNSRTLFDPHFFINQEFTSEGVTCHLLDIHHLSMKSTYRPNEDKHDTAVAKNPFVMLNITLNDVFVDCQGEWQVSAHAFRSKYPFGEGPLSIQTHVEKLYILARVDVQDNHPLMHAFSMQVIVDDVKQVSVLDCNTDLTFAVNVGASYSIIDTVSQKASAMLRSTVEAELCSHIRSTSFAEGFTRLPFFSRVMLQMPLSSLSKNVATSSSRFRASKVFNAATSARSRCWQTRSTSPFRSVARTVPRASKTSRVTSKTA
eukprot:TRINITY_DN24099_c0_g1_i1.p1 TRINITY_DN24099_c0_g1~~TRINITY_DN24099_c0_g1_i1.p1  ORF type:complete len:353 (-),score=29.08 TRINITY_DN24099_c0_g1_i1:116-1174(-)